MADRVDSSAAPSAPSPIRVRVRRAGESVMGGLYETCRYCGSDVVTSCRSTRDMEDRMKTPECFAALMFAGGGEYTYNQQVSERFWRRYRAATPARPDREVAP